MGSCQTNKSQEQVSCCIAPSIIVAWILIILAFLGVIRIIATGSSAVFSETASSSGG